MSRRAGTSQAEVQAARRALGKKLIGFRKAAGLTQRQTRAAGLSDATISRLENGSVPTPDQLRAYTTKVGIHPADLEPELSRAFPDVAREIQRNDATGLEPVDDRGVYVTNHAIERVFTDVAYRIGPQGVPTSWDELVVIRPRTPNLQFCAESYLYTGPDGGEQIEVMRGGSIRDVVTSYSRRVEFVIDFDRTVGVGESHVLQWRVTFEGCNERPEPFFAFTPMRDPVVKSEIVILRLQFDAAVQPAEICHAEGRGDSIERALRRSSPLLMSQDGYYERVILGGETNKSYGFRWEW